MTMQVPTPNDTRGVVPETPAALKQEQQNDGQELGEDVVSDDATVITLSESESSCKTSNASLDHLTPSERKVVDEVETSVSLSELEDDQLEECNEKISSKRLAILKRCISEPLHIQESRRSWKALPKPDMRIIRRHSESLRQVQTNKRSSENRRNSSVSFGEIEMRYYSQTLGDNPSVSYGPPISLDWDYEEIEPIALDFFEDNRPPRRPLHQMILSHHNRKNVLSWQYGVTEDEIKKATKSVKKEKFNRSVTRSLVPMMPVEALMESAGRKAKRAFGKKSAWSETNNLSSGQAYTCV